MYGGSAECLWILQCLSWFIIKLSSLGGWWWEAMGNDIGALGLSSLWGWVSRDGGWIFLELVSSARRLLSRQTPLHVLSIHVACGSIISGTRLIIWDLLLLGNEGSPGFMRRHYASQFLSSFSVTRGCRKGWDRPQEIKASVCRQMPKISHGKSRASALSTSESKTKTDHL